MGANLQYAYRQHYKHLLYFLERDFLFIFLLFFNHTSVFCHSPTLCTHFSSEYLRGEVKKELSYTFAVLSLAQLWTSMLQRISHKHPAGFPPNYSVFPWHPFSTPSVHITLLKLTLLIQFTSLMLTFLTNKL